MKLSVIVPVYNEETHLKDFFTYLMASPSPIEREFIFVDDCSKDSSKEILKTLIEKQKKETPNSSFLLLEQKMNQGKGSAIIRGIQEASGEMTMIQDADFEYDPWDVPELLTALIQNRADVVYGSRFKHNTPQVHRTYHYFVNRFLTLLSNLFSGIYLTDMETCYKIFRTDLLKAMNLKSKRFGIEVELTAYLAKTSARIMEFPIHYHPRTMLQGKKINWKDGVAALGHLVRFNFFEKEVFLSLPDRYNPERSKFEIFKENQSKKN